MIRKTLNWIALLITAALFYAGTRYCLLSDIQGYLTVPFAGGDFGFGHVKSTTVWVGGSYSSLTPLPSWWVWVFYLIVIVAFIWSIRRVLRSSSKGTHAA